MRRLAAAALGLVALGLAQQWLTWPDVGALATENPRTTAFIEGFRRTSGRDPAQQWMPLARISPELQHAVIVAEDIDFFSHRGFAAAEIEAALRDAWRAKRLPRGASTLTQQLAKNLWLSPSRNPWRKAKEALLTRELERRLSKHRLLELYLNVVEFGPGVYGAEAAARTYFGRPAARLSAVQAARLAAALPRPGSWHPGGAAPAAERRAATIRQRMERSRWLRSHLADAADAGGG